MLKINFSYVKKKIIYIYANEMLNCSSSFFINNLHKILVFETNCSWTFRYRIKSLRNMFNFWIGYIIQYNTNLLLSIMTPNILSRTIKWITYIWFHIDWFDWFYNKERKKEGQHNKWLNTIIKSDPAWWSYIISRYLLAHHV